MRLYITGRYFDDKPWELLGVYDSRDKAIERCARISDFISECRLNQSIPERILPWSVYYPLGVE